MITIKGPPRSETSYSFGPTTLIYYEEPPAHIKKWNKRLAKYND